MFWRNIYIFIMLYVLLGLWIKNVRCLFTVVRYRSVFSTPFWLHFSHCLIVLKFLCRARLRNCLVAKQFDNWEISYVQCLVHSVIENPKQLLIWPNKTFAIKIGTLNTIRTIKALLGNSSLTYVYTNTNLMNRRTNNKKRFVHMTPMPYNAWRWSILLQKSLYFYENRFRNLR